MAIPSDSLPAEKSAELRRLFQYLRFIRRVNYKTIASALRIDVTLIYRITSERNAGTFSILDALHAYMASQRYPFPRDAYDNDQYDSYSFGLDYFMDELHISPDIITNSEDKCAGNYILVSLLHNNNWAITWIKLLKTSQSVPMPAFFARRPGREGQDVIYKGFYYEYRTTLFLVGHIADTPFARSLVLVPVGGSNRYDRFGVISGSSNVDALFVSACYLKRLESSDNWRNYEGVLGERDSSFLKEHYCDVFDFIDQRRKLFLSVLRPGGG